MENGGKKHHALKGGLRSLSTTNAEVAPPPSVAERPPLPEISLPSLKATTTPAVLISPTNDGAENDHRPGAAHSLFRIPDTAGFRQNVMEFLHVMYGRTPLDDIPTGATDTTASAPSKQAAMGEEPPSSHQESGTGSPEKKTIPPLRRAMSHHVIRETRVRPSGSASVGGSVSEDHLDTLLLHILKGYKQMGGKSLKSAQGPSVNTEPGHNVSLFVNQALDKYLVREASFSAYDAHSMRSSLSAGAFGFFPKLASFQPKSQISLRDDDSEALVVPGQVGKMAVFAPVSSPRSRSVSKPLPLGPLPFKEADPCHQTLDMTRSIQRNTLHVPRFESGGDGRLLNMDLTHKMSLDSNAINRDFSESWAEDAPASDRPSYVSKAKSREKIAVTPAPPPSSPRPLHDYFNAKKPNERLTTASEGAECVMREEDLKRSVLTAVERRFRDYLDSLQREEAAEFARRNVPCRSAVLSVMGAAAHPPMVQNLLDFFRQ